LYKRLEVLLAFALLTAVGLGGCVEVDSYQHKQTAQVDLYELSPSILNAPQYVAIDQGFFSDEGLTVELTAVKTIEDLITALQEGQADIGLAGAEVSIKAYQAGQEDHLVNFSQLTQREGSFLLGRQREYDFQWERLLGKTIMIGYSEGKQVMVLDYILKQHGLNPEQDVDIIIDLNAVENFTEGMGDYVVVREPEVTCLGKAGVAYPQASLGTCTDYIADTVYMARKSILKNNPDMIQKFSNAVYQAQLWMDSHSPDETARAIAPFFLNIEANDLAEAVGRYQVQNTWRVTTVMDEQSFDLLQEIICRSEKMDAMVESSLLIDNRFTRKAVLSTGGKHY